MMHTSTAPFKAHHSSSLSLSFSVFVSQISILLLSHLLAAPITCPRDARCVTAVAYNENTFCSACCYSVNTLPRTASDLPLLAPEQQLKLFSPTSRLHVCIGAVALFPEPEGGFVSGCRYIQQWWTSPYGFG